MSVAGWYPDPDGGGQLRWWDGERWGSETKPAAPPRMPLPPKIGDSPREVGAGGGFPQLQKGTTKLPEIKKLPPKPGSFPRENLSSVPSRQLPPRIGELKRPTLPPAAISSTPPRAAQPAQPSTSSPETPVYAENPASNSGMAVRDASLAYGFSGGEAFEEQGVGVEERHPHLAGTAPSSSLPPKQSREAPAGKKVKKFWTKTTILISSISILTTVLLPFGVNFVRDSLYQRADSTAEKFVEGLESGSWEKYATDDVFNSDYVPIYGNFEVYKASGMEIDVQLGDISYNNPCSSTGKYFLNYDPEGCSNQAEADITVSYSLDGIYKVVSEQSLQLSRPFYYGDDVASAPKKHKKATAVGDWSVTRVKVVSIDESSQLYSNPDIEELQAADNLFCSTPASVFVEMSKLARIEERIASQCSVKDEDRRKGESFDAADLVKNFPIYNEATILGLKDTTGLVLSPLVPISPFSQYELTTESGRYVFSFVMGGASSEDAVLQLFSIDKISDGGDDENEQ